jgi:hypothetical protein
MVWTFASLFTCMLVAALGGYVLGRTDKTLTRHHIHDLTHRLHRATEALHAAEAALRPPVDSIGE